MIPPALTANEVRAVINHEHNTQGTEYAMVCELIRWAQENQGKKLTERNKPDGYHIRKEYGMTHLIHEAYWRARYQSGDQHEPGAGLSILIAHQTTNVVIPPPDEMAKDTGQDARYERQRQRAAMLESDAPERIATALANLRAAVVEAEDAIPWDFPDHYAILKAAGIKSSPSRCYSDR